MTPLEKKCLYYAEKLHSEVVYGGGLVMLDQVKGTTELVAKNSALAPEDKEVAVCAALLHKSWETKRIAEGVTPLTNADVAHIAGTKVAAVVAELATEPESEDKSKEDQWKEKAEWAKTLSPAAQEILLAEKIMNFRVSRDKPNMKKPLAWHAEYFKTRMLMVDALRDVNPALYREAVQTQTEGLDKINALQAAIAKKQENILQ